MTVHLIDVCPSLDESTSPAKASASGICLEYGRTNCDVSTMGQIRPSAQGEDDRTLTARLPWTVATPFPSSTVYVIPLGRASVTATEHYMSASARGGLLTLRCWDSESGFCTSNQAKQSVGSFGRAQVLWTMLT